MRSPVWIDRDGRRRTLIAPGFVYLIQAGKTGPIKVGYAGSVADRVAKLQAGNHQKLHVLATARGYRADEGFLHECLGQWRLRGDWFSRLALSEALVLMEALNSRVEA